MTPVAPMRISCNIGSQERREPEPEQGQSNCQSPAIREPAGCNGNRDSISYANANTGNHTVEDVEPSGQSWQTMRGASQAR